MFLKLLLFCLLLIFCWPVAILALILFPFIWLILLPFRIAGIVVGSFFSFLKAILMLPARMVRRVA